jgi:hypothetical protein
VGVVKADAKVVRVAVSPIRLLDELERGQAALQRGDQSAAQASLDYAVAKLQAIRAVQDVALDEATQTPETQAPKVTPPYLDRPEDEH